MRYRHRYRVELDYFLRMASERRWQIEPIHHVLYVCEAGPVRRWRVVDCCIGTYGPISQCFSTNRVPARPDPRVIPWCDCCWQRETS
jgi:hypothetical protein